MRSIGGPCMLKSLTRLCRFDDVGTLFLLKEHFRQKGTGIWISRHSLIPASSWVYIINFGLAKKYRGASTSQHIPYS
ncbi:uncharacterized protein LOC112492781 isoform X2 [Ziziphus jujuba]|uniref:Uncharacterized protein LOC112492781 isoform X2 n=1 Tax=Ziziphus jujuba TaxID=326968 RepID=A0ABM4AHA2_ZIZJJ|nr:uncharacterized protein LOC112492781 isoform X2 [Ziziphus jujuba]